MTHTVPVRSISKFRRRVLAAATALVMGVGLAGVATAPAMAAGTGVVSGTVTGTGNAPLQGISVQIFLCDPNYNPEQQLDCWTYVNTGQILTGADGTYSIPNLDAGQYTAAFFPQSGANLQYAYEYWNNKTTRETATAFTVADGTTTTISPNLQVGATISGTVLGPDSQPAPLTMVSATNTATPNQSSNATVQSDGTYQFIGLQPGEYYLWAGPDYSPDNPSTLVREYYDNKPDAASATRFTVASAQTFTANFQLANGGIISGNVKNTSSTNLEGIDVTAFEKDEYGYWRSIETAVTDAAGNYSIEGLESGNYAVRFSDFGGTYGQRFGGGSVDRETATLYPAGPGTNATVNGQLSAGGSITGTITQTPTGESAVPSQNAYVDIIKVAGGVHEVVDSVRTNASGVYSLSGLAPGTYTIQTYGTGSTWAVTYRGPAYYPEDASTLAVTASATANAGTTNIVPGTSISGYFTDTNLAPVPSVRVNILYERTPGNWVAPPPHGGSGDINYYNTGGMPPGKYIVYFEDTATTGTKYVTQYYNNKPTLGTADILDATNGGDFDDITARMTKDPWPAVTASATASPASPNGSNGWYKSPNGNVTVTLTSGGGTAVADKLEYKIGTGAWTAYTAPIVVSANGATTITYRAVEEGLQTSAEGTLTVKRDTAVPTVSSTLSGRTVTITSNDTGGSGLASTEYRLATSGAWTAYTGPVAVGNDAVTVQFRATDAAGNVSTVGSRAVTAATVSISTTSSPTSPNGANGWYTSNVTVTGSGSSSSGGTVTVASKVGTGSYADQASRTVSTEGTATLTFQARDSLGVYSSELPVTIKLDKTKPTANHEFAGGVLTLTGSDAASGIDTIQYRAQGSGDWLTYTTPVTPAQGVQRIEYRATDKAGLVSTVSSVNVALPEPERISGANRYDTAVQSSTAAYPDPFPANQGVVYVTTGTLFPDALSAGPAAAFEGGPLLLVRPTDVPASVIDEIERLSPDRIVVIGGEPSVSAAAFDQLAAIDPAIEVTRIQGANRYETSRKVTAAAFSEATVAYIATGVNFPDALAAGGAAGSKDAPVILVQGGATDLDSATADLLDDLGVTEVKVLGGPTSVSAGIEADLKSQLGASKVERLAGANRYETARLVNEDAFIDTNASPRYVFLSTGLNFPDALAGSAWAAKEDSPLYTVQTDCIPPAVLADITELKPDNLVLLGGTPTLSEAVANLTPCA